jgi:hypothetical protein
MRFKCFLLAIGLGLVFGPVAALTPLRGQSDKGGEGGTSKRKPAHLTQRWEQLAGKATVWRRADIKDPLQQFAFDLIAERVQAVNGEITKEQFLGMSPSASGKRTDDPARKMVAAGESPKTVERKSPAPAAAPPAGSPEEGGSVAGVKAEFRRLDANHDGLLDNDEMDEGLRAERDRWDTNGDGFIDLNEFKAYYKARRKLERAANRPAPAPGAGGKKPVITKGNTIVDLPPNLPPWFREYDTDGDGQIGLYEWRAAGQPIARFREMDFNGDGFLTPDEVLGPEGIAKALEAKEANKKKEEPQLKPEPDPGSLMAYQNQIGKMFAFTVTGSVNGAVWGSGVYTADSTLATAAVHAGVLKDGKTGTVKVRIVAPPESFGGSTAHGVTTRPFGQFPGAYQIVK